ncbi:MAG: hypothetical protein K2H92_03645 [Bacteroidaceae bacterium]|nr:hypothetical protein [Bacteroidaceae bacterium]
MEKRQPLMPFPVHISVENCLGNTTATTLLHRFIEQAKQSFDVTVMTPPSGTDSQAEAIISVPFADRERIRIAFNIYASEAEDIHGVGLYFHMESASPVQDNKA